MTVRSTVCPKVNLSRTDQWNRTSSNVEQQHRRSQAHCPKPHDPAFLCMVVAFEGTLDAIADHRCLGLNRSEISAVQLRHRSPFSDPEVGGVGSRFQSANQVIIAGCGGDKLILGGVIAGWTFGSLGDTGSVIAGSRESYRRLAWLEYEGSDFLGQGNSRTNFWR